MSKKKKILYKSICKWSYFIKNQNRKNCITKAEVNGLAISSVK